MKTKRDDRMRRLLADYGYRLEGRVLIRNRDGHLPERIFRSGVRDLGDAVEQLIPIIREDEFTRRASELV